MQKRAVIISGSPVCFLDGIKADDFIIACDYGVQHALQAGIKPNLIIGDFDSYVNPLPKDIPVLTCAAEKDDTDTFLGLKEALRRGYTKILLLCALGGRLDHTYANICTAVYAAQRGCTVEIQDENTSIFALKNAECKVEVRSGYALSIFSWSDTSRGVSISGAKYSLQNAEINNLFPLGISNEFKGCPVTITVQDGLILIILSKKAD